MKLIFIYSIVALFFTDFLAAQDFSADQQYQQAMANAKLALQAEQYSQAVMFYREARKLKPNERLPKYKIEDIRTIYINKEMNTVNAAQPDLKKQVKSKRKQKKLQAKIDRISQKAVEKATRKMYDDADQAAADMLDFDVAVVSIVEDDEKLESENVDNIASSRELGIADLPSKKNVTVQNNIVKESSENLPLSKRQLPEKKPIKKQNQEPAVNQEKTETPRPKPVMTKPAYKVTKPGQMTAEQKKQWIKEENQKLANRYPNKKTVETYEKPGKKITRVIMNIDGKVSIYMIVKHSWGATYYFKDELGENLKSINQQYFNLMTNLQTYEKP